MKSMQKKLRKIYKKNTLHFLVLGGLLLGILLSGCSFNEFFSKNESENLEDKEEIIEDGKGSENIKDSKENQESEAKLNQTPEKNYTEIHLAAIGDIMFHDEQLRSGYNAEQDTYDFKSMFEDVRPILQAADLTIANFETTMAGPEQPFVGYPQFNSPDEVADAIQNAGVDVLTTANNHSLDTRDEGLKRTVKVLREKGFDTVGTYDEKPDSRVLIKEVEDITFAIIAYTESTNGLGAQYPKEELDAMLNLMEKDKILADIQEAKDLEADFIIALMHWGDEYVEEPNEKQVEFAKMMAHEGVDLILGSHPHVVQKSDVIDTGDRQTYVVYSLGNFISNQRVETLGDHRKPTEDGLIVNFLIRKDHETEKTTIQEIDYIPTWVYRHKEKGEKTYTYRVLPIENFLVAEEITDVYRARMEEGLEATMAKMIQDPFSEEDETRDE